MGQNCCKENNVCNKIMNNRDIEEILEDRYIPKDVNINDLEYFLPDIDEGRVMKIYDGDTFTIACKPKNTTGKIYKYSVRVSGVDCPEIRSTNKNEVTVAELARDKLALMLYKNMIGLKNIKHDKYSKRIVADVWYEDIKISDWLIENRFAVPYDGGTKHPPECWLKYHNNTE